MGLQSALTTALTGLQAAETSIDVVGNNVANSNTVGFKESNVIFATQFLQTQSIGSAPNENRGGTNPRQIGLGAKVAEIAPDYTQGTIEISSNPLDIAIQGDGFLMVQDLSGRPLYTRNGQLKLNANNEIVTSTGNRVLGYGADDSFNIDESAPVPLTIPLGARRVAQETSNAVLSGVLNPAVDEAATPAVTESEVFSDANIVEPDDSSFTEADVTVTQTPTQPVAATSGSAGPGPAAGDYSYRVAFVDSNGQESSLSPEISVNHTGGAPIDLTSVPAADGSTWVDRVVYRTTDGGGDFYRVGSLGDATTTTFSDAIDDATLTGNAPLNDSVLAPSGYSYYVTFFNPTTGVESRPTSRIGPETISDAAGGRIRLEFSDIPSPPPSSGFSEMRVYRNSAGSSNTFRRLPISPPLVTDQSDSAYLSSYVDSFDSAALASQPEINLNGPAANQGTALTDVLVREGDSFVAPFQEGVLRFQPEQAGAKLSQQEMEITSSTTVADLLSFVEETAGINTDVQGGGSVEIVDGRIRVTSNLGEQNAVSIPLTAFQLTPTGGSVASSLGVSFANTQEANGPGTSTEMIVYDSLGAPMNVRLTTILEETSGNSTTYRWFATSGESEPVTGQSIVVGSGTIEFDSEGRLSPGGDPRIVIPREMTASNSPVEIAMDFSGVSSLVERNAQNELTSSLSMTSQDGFAPGVLTDFTIAESGRIQGQFSNGVQRDLGQILMARFVNPGGLQQVGDSLFNVGVNSGEPFIGEPGEDGIGTLTAGAVELSNTDIGQNLIELILSSTQYRGGARVITAAQELLDELLALRR